MLLVSSVLVVSSANTKPAEARADQRTLARLVDHAAKLQVETRPVAPVAVSPAATAESTTTPSKAVAPKLRRLRENELSPALLKAAADVVRRHHQSRIGTEVALDIDGKQVIARLERHFHPEGGELKPWGYHLGVSLLTRE